MKKQTPRMAMSASSHFFIILVTVSSFVLLGCKSAKVTSEHEFASVSAGKPVLVYVADFELSAGNIQYQQGVLSDAPGPIGSIGDRLAGAPEDPQARARRLVDLMADTIVKDLQNAGFVATRVGTVVSPPTNGWLVRGVFTEVQEGNRLRRAMIGFGMGATDLQVVTSVDNLSQGPPKPLYEVATEASIGKAPGAAPTTIVLGPYGAAARFVMSGKDLEKNVKQTASQIAKHIAERVQESGEVTEQSVSKIAP